MECPGGGHRVGARGSGEKRGQGDLCEEMGLNWTSKDGQNLNRWSSISLANIVIRSMGALVLEGGQWDSVWSSPFPQWRLPAGTSLFSVLEDELWLPLRRRPKKPAPTSYPPGNIPFAPGVA